MGRFHNEWGEAKNVRSRKPGESDYVPVEEIPDEGKDPESLLIAREDRGGENDELPDMRRHKEAVGSMHGDRDGGVGESNPTVEGLRKSAIVKGAVYHSVLERRSCESEKRGKGGKLNKPVRDRGELKKAA
ncbi:MAG: hypothetical protein A2921_02870 [Candidatus Magasanikbacteria bacterium RIFCSPLOWO2_01_FULL_43_20b]|uniref:Uncharacterized protein n=1 Tax=Candidatus Magasanikbacteria bacterium RIFCSPLOWO2_12_FULL_43_12 TaxID=1798692 RepID=A0A1F6MTN2_9BACT|nr:MAG: hypothetical protein A3C74_00775 [Candidatus Magasanikbacteria bacterium RIFCSPHIGHO2_02_FULL_44_13]OGH72936.1 MAG: hypothetical protein A2921_02870 [Candidatus Magasanikbacteria bacterium RIFCSPLOWO2_01_FULL_43_20b]OGH74981.1 MAG: hypothetical protein A3G00_01360 [Candidatus Magasanikbacteria bacterium RIFCSPLOWO2_12_FULL_43_12]